MTAIDDLSALDLAALVASRVCHDIISPVGAITNGPNPVEAKTSPTASPTRR